MDFGTYLRELRLEKSILLRELAAAVNMDTALLSKIEIGKRKARKEQVTAFARALQADHEEMHKKWLADQIYDLIKKEDNPTEILRAAEEQAEYFKKTSQSQNKNKEG
jgi:transcriptional regulator with XRE-family HTH domain